MLRQLGAATVSLYCWHCTGCLGMHIPKRCFSTPPLIWKASGQVDVHADLSSLQAIVTFANTLYHLWFIVDNCLMSLGPHIAVSAPLYSPRNPPACRNFRQTPQTAVLAFACVTVFYLSLFVNIFSRRSASKPPERLGFHHFRCTILHIHADQHSSRGP